MFGQGPVNKPTGTRCHRLFESETCRLVQGHASVGVHVRGTALSGDGGVSWRRGAPSAVQCTQTRGMRDYAIDRAHRSTSTSPWYTCSPEDLNVCRAATRWNTELPSTPTGASG